MLGIVGLSGHGKSTLLNIMAANTIPSRGGVELKGPQGNLNFPGNSFEDIIRYREQVALISQESHLFSGSLAFNIALSKEIPHTLFPFWEWIKERIPYLRAWGLELDSVIGPRELGLGQEQLLVAIRSCFLQRPIVLFDEISSALDGDLEEALRETVLLIQRNALTVIVAHRLETIMGANQILVLHDGQIADRGHHYDLVDKSRIYRQFLRELSPTYPLLGENP